MSKLRQSNCSTYGFFPRKAMGYGISESYGFSLLTNLVNLKLYEILKSMGYRNYGLWEIQLYIYNASGAPCRNCNGMK